MKANELRIGNLVIANIIYQGAIKSFEKFNQDLDVVFFSDGGIHGIGEFLEDVQPIPLTEEWLLKFGFISNPYTDRYEFNSFHIWCSKTKGFLELYFTYKELKYVHQLQNLYFALTNEELKIN